MAASEDKMKEFNLEGIYQDQAAFFCRLIERLTGDPSAIEDILQEAFLVAHRKRASFDPAKASARSWLFGIVVRLCARHRRSLGRRFRLFRRLDQQGINVPPEQPDAQIALKDEVRHMYQLLEALPCKQRQAFVLYEIEELATKEIAGLMGISANTVFAHLHQARKRFKKIAPDLLMQEPRAEARP